MSTVVYNYESPYDDETRTDAYIVFSQIKVSKL